MFGSRVGFSGSADQMVLLLILPNSKWQAAILENSNSNIASTDYWIHSMFCYKV